MSSNLTLLKIALARENVKFVNLSTLKSTYEKYSKHHNLFFHAYMYNDSSMFHSSFLFQ